MRTPAGAHDYLSIAVYAADRKVVFMTEERDATPSSSSPTRSPSVAPMKEVVRIVWRHFDGILAWTRTRQTNGVTEAFNGPFQADKRNARGYNRFATMRTFRS
jgi:transposase